jgi:regulator of protease activity HflC (stomatin/prohibitin superfamily)
MSFLAFAFVTITFLVLFYLIFIQKINEYQRGVTLTFGKFSGIKNPGWRIIIPVFQEMIVIDTRTKAVDVPDQETMTIDNISCTLNAVIYYKVVRVDKAFLEVENFYYAISQLAQTTMRNIVGEITLDELLANRDEISEKIKKLTDKATDPWGIRVEEVALKDIILPDDMKRTMSKQAEAEREKRAVIIKAEGEVIAADNLKKAADTLAQSSGALHLRTLQSINDISSDQSNTTIWMIPVEIMRAIEGFTKKK